MENDSTGISEILNNIKERTDNEQNESYVEGKDVVYQAGKVSEMLGISRDMVRYYVKEFEEYLQIDYTTGGHMRFHSEDIELLRTIVLLRKTKNAAEVKSILDDPSMKMLYGGNSDLQHVIAQLFVENNRQLVEQLRQMIENGFEMSHHLLEQKDNTNKELKEELDKVHKELEEVRKASLEQTELMQKFIEDYEAKNDSHKKGLLGRLFKNRCGG